MTKLLSDTADDVALAAHLLSKGEVVALPTETVYGLAANALDDVAVRQIFNIKGRPLIDPLIVHVGVYAQLDPIVNFSACRHTSILDALAQAFWPGPMTIVLPKKPVIPDLVTAGKATVAVRIPRHPLTRAILSRCQLPLAAPSANPFGYVSPTRAEHVTDSLGVKIAYVVDGGPCDEGLESTIIDLSYSKPRVLRPGPISIEQLETHCKTAFTVVERYQHPSTSSGETAPGSLYRHYSPNAQLILIDADTHVDALLNIPELNETKCAYVSLGRIPVYSRICDKCRHFWLSETQHDLKNAAKNVFHLLREIDRQNYEWIFFERPPMHGVGVALNDRLRRAAARSTQ